LLSTQIPGQFCVLARPPADFPPEQIYAQPCDEPEIEARQRNLVVAIGTSKAYGYRLSIQIHKVAGLP
jgi:hypothetical protein